MNIDKHLYIRLIGHPDFYETNSGYLDLNLNRLFWEFIFSDAILSLGLIRKISEDDAIKLKFILKNIKLAYNIFYLYSRSAPEVYHLLFAFNIIDSYLEIINKHLKFEEIKFYNYFQYKRNIYDNIEETLIYAFLMSISDKLILIPDESTIHISMELSEQVYQIKILQYILKSLHKDVSFIIDISNIKEFENKISIKKIIINNIDNIVDIVTISPQPSISVRLNFCTKLLGFKNISSVIFNAGCSYRKCVFCNIGKGGLKLKNECDNIIDDLISGSKEGNLNTLHLGDPDIQPEEILYISEKFIQSNVDIKMHIRTRFSKKYTLENLKIMYNGGVRFMGIGLESGSKRINNLMNKYEEEVGLDDFDEIIANCIKVGINIHLYTILGFPTETKSETKMTKNYLLKNLSKYPFFSYTPGLFGLGKGTYMYNNPEKYNLRLVVNNLGEETFVDFYEKNTTQNAKYLLETARGLVKSMFFGDRITTHINVHHFWCFIETSDLFHIYKMYYTRNPFLDFFSKNTAITDKNYLNEKYILIRYYDISKKANGIYVKNWINFIELKIDSQIVTFLEYYDQNKTLNENLHKSDGIDIDLIFKMINNYFLIKK